MAAASDSELEVEVFRADDDGLNVGYLGWGDDEKWFGGVIVEDDSGVLGGG